MAGLWSQLGIGGGNSLPHSYETARERAARLNVAFAPVAGVTQQMRADDANKPKATAFAGFRKRSVETDIRESTQQRALRAGMTRRGNKHRD